MLSPEEAAQMFGVTRRWLLERADDLPGARRLSKKVIRFSERALSRHLSKGRA
jgi:helix-turn-helix protein